MNSFSTNQSTPISVLEAQNISSGRFLLLPETSLHFLVIDIVLLGTISFFSVLILLMVQREKKKKAQSAMLSLLITYSVIVPVIVLLMFFYFHVVLRYANPPFTVLGDWFCVLFQMFTGASGLYLSGLSLFTAIIKYKSLMNRNTLEGFEKENAHTMVFVSHLLIPGMLSFFYTISHGKNEPNFMMDSCWSTVPESKITDYNILQRFGATTFCYNREYDINEYFSENAVSVIVPILRCVCGTVKTLFFLLCSNIAELVMYTLLFRYINR